MMNFKRPMSSTFMMITPDIARSMLATSTGNRKLRRSHIKDLSEAILRGEWRPTNQGIGFDDNGILKDGHHRLNAVIRANQPIQIQVTFGMPSNAVEVIDCNIVRTYADRMLVNKWIAETLRLAAQIAFWCCKPSVEQLKTVAATGIYDISEELLAYCGGKEKIVSTSNFKLAAVLSVLNGGDKNYVFDQYRALCLANYKDMSPITQALNKLIQRGGIYKICRRSDHTVMAYGFKVLDAKNANFSSIRFSEGEILNARLKAKEIMYKKEPLRSMLNTESQIEIVKQPYQSNYA
jgi:hypothetical protein